MLNFCDFIQVYVFTTNHHLKALRSIRVRVTYFGAPAPEFPTLLLEQYTYMRALQGLKGVYPLLWLLRG